MHLESGLQMSADEETPYPKFLKGVKYADEATLQSVDICLPKPTSRHHSSKFWVMYEYSSFR